MAWISTYQAVSESLGKKNPSWWDRLGPLGPLGPLQVMHLAQGALASASTAAKRMLSALEQVPDSLLSLLEPQNRLVQSWCSCQSTKTRIDTFKMNLQMFDFFAWSSAQRRPVGAATDAVRRLSGDGDGRSEVVMPSKTNS